MQKSLSSRFTVIKSQDKKKDDKSILDLEGLKITDN